MGLRQPSDASVLEELSPEEVREKLANLDVQVYHEIRSYRNPPDMLVQVIACAALLLGETETDWNSLKKFLLHCRDRLIK